MAKDLTREEYEAELNRLGIEIVGVWRMAKLPNGIVVSPDNGGKLRKDKLAYLQTLMAKKPIDDTPTSN